MESVTIYPFPESQQCMECKYGEFMQSLTFDNSHYLCLICCTQNDGIYCPEKEEQLESANEKV